MKRIPLVLSLLAMSSASARAAAEPTSVAYAPPARTAPLGSTVVDWSSLRFKASPVGLYCAVFDEPTPSLEKLEVHITTLNPGMSSHTPHHHPWEEMLLVKEGQLEMSINGKKEPAGPGSLIFIASHDVHNVTNVGDKPATYYVINFVTAAVHSVRDQPAAEWAPPAMLTSRVVDCDSIPNPPKGGHREVLDSSPTLTSSRGREEPHLDAEAGGQHDAQEPRPGRRALHPHVGRARGHA